MAYRVINQNAFEVVVGGKTIPPSGWAVVQVIPQGVPSEVFSKLIFTLTNDPNIDDASIGYEAAVGLGSSGSAQGAAADNVLTSILSSSTRMGQVAQAARSGSDGGTISTGRNLTSADDGKQFVVSTALTITIPAGLSPRPSVILTPPPSGNLTIAVSGEATINGGTSSLTRTRADNPGGVLIQAYAESDAYGVTGGIWGSSGGEGGGPGPSPGAGLSYTLASSFMTPDEPGSAAANRIALEEALASGPVWLDANTEFYVDPIEIPAYAVLHGAGATSSLRGGGGASILKSGIGSWNGTQGAWLRGFNLKGSATTALKLNFHPAIRVEDITLIGFVGTTGFDFAFVFASTLRGLYSYDSTISGQIFKLGAAFNANHCANWYTNGGATYGLYWDSTSELSLGSSFDALCVQGHATGIYLGPKVSNCRIDAYFENCTTEYTLDTSSERPRGIQWGFRANPLKTKKRGPRDQWYGRFTGNQGNKGHRTTTGTLATTTSSAYLGKTHQAVMTAECPFYAVRVRLLNSSANTQTIDNVAVAPSANFSSNSTPTGSWIQATFGGSASVVLPARLATNQPSITFSDWMPIVSIPRTDGDGRPMLYMRAFNGSSTEATITDGGAFNQAQWNAANSNTLSRLVKGGYDNTGGNYVASAQASFALTTGALLAIDFEYLALGTVLTVSGLGDSITDGTGGPISVMGASWGHRACAALSTPTNPVAWSNLARSGSNTAFFLERLQGLLAGGMRPHVLVYSPFSPNDTTPTQALMDAARARLAQVMELCKTYNIIPVVWTGLPYAYNSTADAFRVAFNNDIRALAQKGVAVVDMDAVMSDGATPARMIRSPVDYTDTNLLHPSDAGVAVMTAAFQEVLAQIVENYFRDLG